MAEELTDLSVHAYMATRLIKLSPDQEMQEAIRILLRANISGAPVVGEQNRLIGMLSEKDCLRTGLDYSFNKVRGALVEDYMSRDVVTVDVRETIADVAERFINSSFRRFPVVDSQQNDRLVGQISRRDILKSLERIGV